MPSLAEIWLDRGQVHVKRVQRREVFLHNPICMKGVEGFIFEEQIYRIDAWFCSNTVVAANAARRDVSKVLQPWKIVYQICQKMLFLRISLT